jgi:DNA-binding Xre family transcriptional regulator
MKNENITIPTIEELLRKAKPKKPKETIKNRLGEVLAEKQMTQQELSDLTGLYPSHISEIITGKRKGVTLPTALKISQALNVEITDIFY